MAAREKIVIVGAGHNGLVAACHLAKAGYAPTVVERQERVGGALATEEIHPGFRCPALIHAVDLPETLAGSLEIGSIAKVVRSDVRMFAPSPDGSAVFLYEDERRTATELAKVSSEDSRKYPEFAASFANIGRVLAPLLALTPPDIKNPTRSDMWEFGKIGLKFRGLSKPDAFRLLRWGPMAVADLVSEWFETELLRAAIAARGIFGAFAGPWSAGTSAALLLQAAACGRAIPPATIVSGGMGALGQALAQAAAARGATIRTGAGVQSVSVTKGRVSGVVLETGEEIPADVVLSNADPHTTLLKLVDPADLDPGFVDKIRSYRIQGAVAKVHLALAGLPTFSAAANPTALSGRIHIGPELDYLEKAFDAAKYGDISPSPYLDVTIPTLLDPTLAPKGAHVMSIHVQYAPYRLRSGNWETRRDELGDAVIRTLSAYAPNLRDLVIARQVLSPVDIEQKFGLSGGHILHGEQALDQLFAFRPLLGWAQYRTPIAGLYLCGAGTHPGGVAFGASGSNASREVLKDLRQ